MANRDSDTSLWLHNKLGVSNDSWISGSICSQLNKEVLRNIKDCFPDLQTQVKLKLLLSFFHIPRRLVEEWKTELDEIIEVAGLDSELWVSMLAETMKTFPASGSLNTEISDYEETRPIFTDMVNDLRRLVSKHSDLGMLPLECQYLNKNALISVVGQQPNPVKHFTLKRKPKSVTLRNELLQKSADAQSSLKKSSAPTIPLRTRGMPRKMTDTTPLKGIPSRVPTSGFRSPTGQQNQRPNMSRTPAGRKDGGIKVIDFTEQPLGFAAQKKRKRQLELEEQQKKALEQKQAANTTTVTSVNTTTTPTNTTTSVTTPTSTTPDYAAGLTSVYTQPPTPAVSIKDEPVEKKPMLVSSVTSVTQNTQITSPTVQTVVIATNKKKNREELNTKIEPEIKMETNDIKLEEYEIKEIVSPKEKTIKSPPLRTANQIVNSLPNNISVKITQSPVSNVLLNNTKLSVSSNSNSTTNSVLLTTPQIRKQTIVSNSTQTQTTPQIRSIPISQLPKPGGAPLIISQTIIKPAGNQQQNQIFRNQQQQQIVVSSTPVIQQTTSVPIQVSVASVGGGQQQTQYILSSASSAMPTLTSFAQARPSQTIIQNPNSLQTTSATPTKILIKTAPTIPAMISTSTTPRSNNQIQTNPPPLISTQTPTILNIQNVNLPNRAVTIQPASQAAQVQHIQAQLQAQQHQHTVVQQQSQQSQQIQAHTVVSNTNATQQPKFTLMSPKNINTAPGKTIYLAQKGVILRSIGGDMYQQIPISNVSNLNNLDLSGTIVTSSTGGLPTLVKTTNSVQQPIVKHTTQQIPALIPANNLPVVITSQNVQQQPQQGQAVQTIIGNPPQQTIIRPVISNLQGNITTLSQGLTLIQRPGQQPQLVQVQPTQQQGQQIQRAIITTQQNQQQNRPQQIIIQQRPQTIITQQPQQQILQRQQTQPIQQVQQPQRKGLSLSNEHVIKAHEMFRKANKVSRPDKALILGFMAGLRENPRPNPENVIVIKLGENEEKAKQDDGSFALCLVESLIRLDYNTGEWKTFQNYRRIDQSSQNQQQDTKLQQTPNSVIIQ